MDKPKILLAEDDANDEKLFRLALERANIPCEVTVVRDGIELIDLLFANPPDRSHDPEFAPDLIVLDLKMPKLDGLKVLTMLRSVRGGQQFSLPPIVVFTSSDEIQDRVDAYGSGAHSFVRKPVNFGRFVEAVQQTVLYWLTLNERRPKFVARTGPATGIH